MSYKKLEIWQLAKKLVNEIHEMSLQLPQFEMFEEGSQIRRSSKSIKSNIAEGYGRRRYKQDFIRFLTYASASCDETVDHLETLFETGSLKSEHVFKDLSEKVDLLGKKLTRFIQSVEEQHNEFKEDIAIYQVSSIEDQESSKFKIMNE